MQTAMSWYHLGLRGRLFTAFGVVAALTVLASGSAIVSYDSLGRSLGAIAENPRLGTVIRRNTRRALLRRFPYGIYYRIYSEVIVVVACIHGRRDPKRWRSRR